MFCITWTLQTILQLWLLIEVIENQTVAQWIHYVDVHFLSSGLY